MTLPTRYDVREYGATSESLDTDRDTDTATDAIQAALDDCAESGGTVHIPSGTYRSAPLRMGSQTTLHLAAGATLSFLSDFRAFPSVESRWEGWDQVGFHPCLRVANAENVAISGRGTIDGSGEYWWDLYETPESERPEELRERLAEFHERNEKSDDVSSFTLRPPLLQVYNSRNVRVSGITIRNSPFWNTHVVYSEDVSLKGVAIENPSDAPNGDGIDIDSSRLVRITDAYINAGDDAICIKSGKDREGREVGEPAECITIANCTIEHGHGGVVIGSEMSGDVRDIVVTNCTFTDTDRGIRLKTQRGRGGTVEDLRFDNIVMRRVVCPFVINGYYFTSVNSDPEPIDETTPMIRNVSFHHITARDVAAAGFLAGLPEQYFEGIEFTDVVIDATRSLDGDIDPSMAYDHETMHGLFCKSIADLTLRDVRIRTKEGHAGRFEEMESVQFDGVTVESAASPALITKNVRTVELRGCPGSKSEGTLLRCSGPDTETVFHTHPDFEDRIEIADDAGDSIESA
jgi:hypothetical protein